MKASYIRFVALVCVFAIFFSQIAFDSSTVSAQEEVSVITAKYNVSSGEISILVNGSHNYDYKVYVSDMPTEFNKFSLNNYVLLVSKDYIPDRYGIVPVIIEAADGNNTFVDSCNIEVEKSFEQNEVFYEDFNSLDIYTMSDSSLSESADSVKSLNNGQIRVSGVPSTEYKSRYLDIVTNPDDNTSALNFRFHSGADRSLPAIVVNPETDAKNGIVELSYDFVTDNTFIRQTIYPISRAYASGLTFKTNSGMEFASSFRVVNYETFCFGSSSKKLVANMLYNIRFLLNLNELSFELYVNDELIDYGVYSYNDSRIGEYIYGIDRFDIFCGVQGIAGASDERAVNIIYDNVKITHADIGASIQNITYHLEEKEYSIDLHSACVPFCPEDITVYFDNYVDLTDGQVLLLDSEGRIVPSTVCEESGSSISAKNTRSVYKIIPESILEIGSSYKISFPKEMSYSGNPYGCNVEIPFVTTPHFSIISPTLNTKVKQGENISIKACILDAESAELYIDDEFVFTLYPDEKSCVTYSYNAANLSLGIHNIELSVLQRDGSYKPLNANVHVVNVDKKDILPLVDFETDRDAGYFSVVKQASADSAAMLIEDIDGRRASSFYFQANSNTDRKVLMIRKEIDEAVTGRVVLDFDMYLAEENKNAELSISFSDDIYTYYPLDIAKQIKNGKINGLTKNLSGWHNIKLIMDTVTQSSEMYMDNEKIGDTCYTYENTYHKSEVSPPDKINAFKSFTVSLWQSQPYISGSSYLGFAVDNWHVYNEMPSLSVDSLTAYNPSGESIFCANDDIIANSVNRFKLSISDAPYFNTDSLLSEFKLYENDIPIDVENIVFSDGVLSLTVDKLLPNSYLKFVLGGDTFLYDGLSTYGSDFMFGIKTADINGLYHKSSMEYDDNGVKAFLSFDTINECSFTVIVAAYSYDKLVSFQYEPYTVKDSMNISISVPGENVTGAKVYIWDKLDSLNPVVRSHTAGTGASGSNAAGLNSIFEKESTALKYIDDAVVFKEDTEFLVYESGKHKYSDICTYSPYIDENGTFMVPELIFEKVFKVDLKTDATSVAVGSFAECQLNSDVARGYNGDNYTLDSPVVNSGKSLYIPLRSFAQDILGYTYLYDRGMHIFDTEEFEYINSPSTYETKEPIDAIYRYVQFERKTAELIYSKMDMHLGGNVHPRILTSRERLNVIKKDYATDPVLSEALTNTLNFADSYINEPCVEYNLPDGKRLLVAAREVMERLVNLSAAYLVTDDKVYADRAWVEMENCFSWKDWNTDKHYLDNSELLYGVSVAFDSLYDYLTDEQKKIIMDKTWELSLKHTVDRYCGIDFSGSEWRTARSNWGFVCNGAVISAIIAFGREDNANYQPYYDFLLECALKAIEYPIMLYYPDGAWEEGMAYWEYSMRYFVGSVLVPLYFSTGSTLDYMLPQGVDKIANMGLYMQGGKYGFNFSDNADEGRKSSEAVYAFAMLQNNNKLMQTWKQEMNSMDATHGARSLMWYQPDKYGEDTSITSLSKDFFFKGVEVGSMKEEWNNPEGSVVFFKGGQNNTGGSHLDVGTFCFDSMGERWAVDLGKDSYNIDGGYNGLAGWELYAKRPEGHNCVVINPRADIYGEYYGGQYLNGRAEIKKMVTRDGEAYSVVDLSDAYKYDANSYIRGFYLCDNRRSLVVQDEINLKEDNSVIYWFMHTRAAIELDSDGKGATLSQNGKKMRLDLVTNAQNARLVVNDVGENVQRFPTDPIRPGQLHGGRFTSVKALTLEATGSGDVYITVKCAPLENNSACDDISYTPIKLW